MNNAVDRIGPMAAVSAALVAAAVVVSFVLDDPVGRGIVIGAALGVANFLIGLHFTRRSLGGDPGAVLVNIAAGFGARFFVLIGLLVVFTFVTTMGVSPAAFGFTFVGLLFVYFGAEFMLALRVQRGEAA